MINLQIRFKDIYELAQYVQDFKKQNPELEPSLMNFDIKNIEVRLLRSNQSTYVFSDNALNQSYTFIMPA